MPLFAFAFGEF